MEASHTEEEGLSQGSLMADREVAGDIDSERRRDRRGVGSQAADEVAAGRDVYVVVVAVIGVEVRGQHNMKLGRRVLDGAGDGV